MIFFLKAFFLLLTVIFNLFFRYALVRNAGTKVVHRSVQEGLGQVVKKYDVLTRSEEKLVLASEGASLSHLHGLNSRMGYFMCRNFFVHGQNELPATNAN
jgi:hypothetical protein